MMDSYDRLNTLQHEWLDAHGVAVELDSAVVAIAQRAGGSHAWIADPALRASASVVLSLAEALGREGANRARAEDRAGISAGIGCGAYLNVASRRLP